MPLFSIPPSVARDLAAHGVALNELTPEMLRRQLRQTPRHAEDVAEVEGLALQLLEVGRDDVAHKDRVS